MEEKSSLRQLAKDHVTQLSEIQRAQYSEKIVSSLSEFIPTHFPSQDTYVGIYASTRFEPNLDLLHQHLPKAHFCYPLCGKGSGMEFYHVESRNSLVPGKFGIYEPSPDTSQKISPEQLSLLCCPAWGFSTNGERLGKGGGYYDRYLSRCKAHRIGIAFSCQLFDKIPVEPHDIAMQTVITELGIIQV